MDKKAFQNATHCMLASEWNKKSAIKDYGVNDAKISVVQCGANIDCIPPANELKYSASGKCSLLFLGVEWERKGGDIALATFRLLQQKGIEPHLHIIGCVPPHDLSLEKDITVIPFLDKNNKDDFLQLHNIFMQTDFLLLPTRAECAGVVFCEASAYGIPSITTDTGGVSDYVKDNINGFALDYEAGAAMYAEKIAAILQHHGELQRLKASSRKRFEEILNWNAWGNSFQTIAQKIIKLK
jgi:glycosyltransferase involved in cell wall biosynthesis